MTERRPDVLVIDDDDDAVAEIAQCLLDCGYSVITASEGIEGFTAAMHFKPRVILCDIIMPGWDGPRIADTLAMSGNKATLIIVSGDGKALRRASIETRNALFFLKKPINLGELEQLVKVAV